MKKNILTLILLLIWPLFSSASECSEPTGNQPALRYETGPDADTFAKDLAGLSYFKMCYIGDSYEVKDHILDLLESDQDKLNGEVNVDALTGKLTIYYYDQKCGDLGGNEANCDLVREVSQCMCSE